MNLVVQLAIFLLGYRLTYVFLSCTGLICFLHSRTLSVFKCPEAAQPLALPAALPVALPVRQPAVLPVANVPVVQLHRHIAVVCVINRNVVVGLCRHLQHLPTRANYPRWQRVPQVNNVDNSVQI